MFDNLTAESYAELMVSNPAIARAMVSDAKLRPLVLPWREQATEAMAQAKAQAKLAEVEALRPYAEAYDNGETFTISGKQYDFFEVVEIALNSLTFRKNNDEYEAHKAKYPSLYARKEEAYKILQGIRDYKGRTNLDENGDVLPDGESRFVFSITAEKLRPLVEANLSK
jgi:hypothetical protein